MTLGEKLKEFRISRGYSQQKLAQLLDVSQSACSAWELNTRVPDQKTLKKIADLFHVPPSVLIADDDSVDSDVVQAMADALHKNPQFKLLFDRSRFLSPSDMNVVLSVIDAITRGRDADE